MSNNIDYAPEMQFIWQRHWTLQLPFRGFHGFADTELLEASDVAGIGAIDPQTDDAVSSLLELRGH